MDKRSILSAVFQRIFVPIEASGRHVHLTQEQALTLFGAPLTEKRPLSQPGQYLSNQRLRVVGPKGTIENVAVLGPARSEAQVEISLTDGKLLGIQPPIRSSGSVKGTPGVRLEGPKGSVELKQGVIAAQRHIHLSPEEAKRFQVRDKQVVKLQTFTDRPLVFENVLVRVHKDFRGAVHLDFDEANACGLSCGDVGRIIV